MEDGEIEDDDENVLNPTLYRSKRETHSSDDSITSDGDSSDNETSWKRRKKNHSPKHSSQNSGSLSQETQLSTAKKRNNIWSLVLSEQSLTEDIHNFGVRQTREKTRSVESYDYHSPKNLHLQNTSHKRKRAPYFKFDYSETESDKDIGRRIADRLNEAKVELIEHVVEEIGRKLAIELLRETDLVEYEGGMMVHNGSRRRSPGGVYLQLLREHDDVTRKQINNIFRDEKKIICDWKRKKRQFRRRFGDLENKEKMSLSTESEESKSELPLPTIIDSVLSNNATVNMEQDSVLTDADKAKMEQDG